MAIYTTPLDNIEKREKTESQKVHANITKEASIMLNGFTSGIFENSILHEFDANGEEEDMGEDDDYTVEDQEDTNTDNNQGNNPNNIEDGNEGNADDDEYALPDEDETDDENTDDDQQTDNTDEEDITDDEYTLDDEGEDDNQQNPDNEEDTEGNAGTEDDNTGDEDDYSLDGSDIDGENNGGDESVQDKLDSIAQIEKELFEKLTPEQKEIKIKALKKNFMDLHGKCNSILDMINDASPNGEAVVKVFDYIQKTVSELQDNMHDYLTNTFDTKSYLDNDAQFKQYLAVLNSVKKILDEFIDKSSDTDK